MLSIVIISYNNLPYLRFCIDSIQKNSHFQNHIIVHSNVGEDGTLEWLNKENITHTHSRDNIGFTRAANIAAEKAIGDYVCLVDDDTYLLPNWDYELIQFKRQHDLGPKDWISSTIIERNHGCAGSIHGDYGSLDNFFEHHLHETQPDIEAEALISTQNTPLLIDINTWREVGGCDEDFFVIGFEEGFAKRMFDFGCRNFVNAPKSLGYHFQSTTTNKISNRGEQSIIRDRVFKEKHDMETREFIWSINRGDKWAKI
jgi:GT2 family glycosyltransferase